MQRKDSGSSAIGLFSVIVFLCYGAGFCLTGIFTYSIVEPDSFFGVVGFLLFWGVLWTIVQILLGYLFVGIAAILS
jgi:ABC-type Na+ efflux pump permease subunit